MRSFTKTNPMGFVGSDRPGSLVGVLTFATTANLTSAAGAYPVVPAGLSSPNSTIVYVPGTLTVSASLRSQKVAVRRMLAGLLPSGDKRLDDRIRDAITHIDNAIAAAIATLTDIDRALAGGAIQVAQAAGGSKHEIADALRALSQGDQCRSDHPDEAIEKYAEAWHEAQEALHLPHHPQQPRPWPWPPHHK